MYVLILFLFLLSGMGNSVQACDVCSGGLGGGDMGVLPQFTRHFAGVRYRFGMGKASHAGLASEASIKDEFHSTELWVRYVPHPRVQLVCNLPFSVNVQQGIQSNSRVHGLGDITLQTQIILWNTAWSGKPRLFNHLLLVGIGIKSPSGVYQLRENGQTIHPNRQPGSGSWDIPFNFLYSFRRGAWGLQLEWMYRLNTTNSLYRKAGDRLSSGMRVFYLWNRKKWSVMPASGLVFEWQDADQLRNKPVDMTGGNALYLQSGLDLFYSFFSTGIRADYPVYQYFTGGRNGLRISAQFLFLFSSLNKKKSNQL